jgi:hypothetical protein
MLCNCRLHRFFKIANALTLLVFVFSGYAFEANAARITPSGKVSVYRVEKLVDELSAEAPLPFDSLLVCSGECWVRMDSFYMAASDQSAFYVEAPPLDKQIVFVKGFYYFSLTDVSKQWVFKTPIEDVTVQQGHFQNEAPGGRLDGYIFVKDETIEIGVLEGGTLVVASSHGEYALEPGKQITVAKVGPQSEMVEAVSAEDDGVRRRTIVIWGLVGAGIIAGAAALSGGGSDSPPPASPSSP